MISQQIILMAIAVFVGSVVQSAAGFGLALIAVVSLIALGMSPALTVMIVVTLNIIVCGMSAWHLRKQVPWKQVLFHMIIVWGAMALGTGLLLKLNKMDMSVVKQIVGGSILLIVIVQLIWRVKPKSQVHGVWGILAYGISGFMAGVLGIGGPPLVLWTIAHDWPAEKTRAILLGSFSLYGPMGIALLWFQFPQDIALGVTRGLLLSPVAIAGAYAGLWVGQKFSKILLRKTAYALLMITALLSILSPWL